MSIYSPHIYATRQPALGDEIYGIRTEKPVTPGDRLSVILQGDGLKWQTAIVAVAEVVTVYGEGRERYYDAKIAQVLP